jgi:hypothetical protein
MKKYQREKKGSARKREARDKGKREAGGAAGRRRRS